MFDFYGQALLRIHRTSGHVGAWIGKGGEEWMCKLSSLNFLASVTQSSYLNSSRRNGLLSEFLPRDCQ